MSAPRPKLVGAPDFCNDLGALAHGCRQGSREGDDIARHVEQHRPLLGAGRGARGPLQPLARLDKRGAFARQPPNGARFGCRRPGNARIAGCLDRFGLARRVGVGDHATPAQLDNRLGRAAPENATGRPRACLERHAMLTRGGRKLPPPLGQFALARVEPGTVVALELHDQMAVRVRRASPRGPIRSGQPRAGCR